MKAIPSPRRAPWTGLASLCGAVALAAAVAVAAGEASGAAASLAVVAAVGAAICVTRAARDGRLREAKLSADITVLSERLLRLESRAAAGHDAAARAEALAGGVAGDLDELARLVASLADSLSDQGRHLQTVTDNLSPSPAEPAPSPALPAATLTTREDFAEAAAAILQKLSRPAAPSPSAPPTRPAADTVADALEAGRVELVLSAVVSLPQRQNRLYDAALVLRTEDGTAVDPAEVASAALRLGRAARLEAHALARATTVARYLAGRDSAARIMTAVSETSLADRLFVSGVEALLGADRAAASRIVLRVPHRDLSDLGADAADALARFVAHGVELACDDVTVLRAGWTHLARMGVRFARVDASLLVETRRPGETSTLVREIAEAGIRVIATGVGREDLVPDLLDFDVPLAQGLAIGAARPVRPEILAANAEPDTSARDRAPPPSPPPVPLRAGAAPSAFRASLRRVG